MNGIVRIASVVPRVSPGNPKQNALFAKNMIEELDNLNPDIILFPALSLSGASCGTLFGNRAILDGCKKSLNVLLELSNQIDSLIVVGLPDSYNGRTYSTCAVIHKGKEIVSRVGEYTPLPPLCGASKDPLQIDRVPSCDAIINMGEFSIRITPCDPTDLPIIAGEKGLGADIILAPCAMPAITGITARRQEAARITSELYSCAVATCGCGYGESTSPYLYKGFAGIFECGQALYFSAQEDTNPLMAISDIDIDILRAGRKKQKPVFLDCPFVHLDKELQNRTKILRDVRTNPYLPIDFKDALNFTSETFELQVSSLMGRMSNTNIQKILVGVSGGLDSALALLVCCETLDKLSIPRQNCIGVSMPGFGTTDRTYYNSLAIMEGLGVSIREVPIKASVIHHFEDIGHRPELRDITYENAQARERAQILFDIANMDGAMVVGTGDLSEAALGWCTFGGDHLATYNVNICLTKTLVRTIMKHLSETAKYQCVSEILTDILDTPVSPELLPLDEYGETPQKTESILGPYELHDFFLFYFVQYDLAPSKILQYASIAFGEQYSTEYIKATLTIFIRRFFSGQFKRNCSPDSAIILTPCLANEYFTMPSDANSDALIDELTAIK